MSIHETLTPTDDAEVQIEATADTLKPVFAYADKLVDELKLRVDEDGIRYKAVDPGNVSMCGIEVPGEAFEAFDGEETVIGSELGTIMSALRAGRKRQNDEISVGYSDQELTTTVHREYDGTEMDLQNTFGTIDPDAIRQEPELPNLDLGAEVTVSRRVLEDAIGAVTDVSEFVRFETDGSDFLLSGNNDTGEANVVVSDVATGDPANSLFDEMYLNDFLRAIRTVGVDEVTLCLGEEFPMRVEWETEFNDATVTGYWFQAPRIQS